MYWKTVLLLCSVSSRVVGYPLPNEAPFSLFDNMLAIIDCDDFVLKEKIASAGVYFRCKPKAYSSVNDIVYGEEYSSSLLNCDGALIYVDDAVMCIPRSHHALSTPQRTKGVLKMFYEQNFPTLLENPCMEGYVLKDNYKRCFPKLENIKEEHGNTVLIEGLEKCSFGHVYNSEVGLCLSVQPHTEQKDSEVNVIDVSHPKKCPLGTVYSPEIDRCLNVIKSEIISPLLPNSLKSLYIPGNKNSEISRVNKCDEGSFYIRELNLCIPFDQAMPNGIIKPNYNKKGTAPTGSSDSAKSKSKRQLPTESPDPFRLTLEPLTRDQVGRRKCKIGMVFVSEIDLCHSHIFKTITS